MNKEPGYGSCRRMESRDEPRAFPHDLENAGRAAAGVSHSSHSPCQRPNRDRTVSQKPISLTADPNINPAGHFTC
jgi:hypothetical protein